jgi:UDP-N-acetylglucosamine 4,6-dehydratase
MYRTANIFVTGGAGCLGRAIAEKRKREGWTGKLTVYSRDTFKHERMRRMFPDVNFIQGDILSPELLYNAMVGHDIVIHAAACKVIPTSEYQSMDTIEQNIIGSQNVCAQAVRANIKHVLGISTDKACKPINAYGATKFLMEKTFQEYSRMPVDTEFHLIRYGNVLESTGSVIEVWRKAVENGDQVKLTDPKMTRFWLSPRQAADYAINALAYETGEIFIPVMPSLSIGKLFEYVIGKSYRNVSIVGLRPGEKYHETLLTDEETAYAEMPATDQFYVLHPTTSERHRHGITVSFPHTSDTARELTKKELFSLLKNE